MSNWIITPDKYLSTDEIKQLKRTLAEIAEYLRYRKSDSEFLFPSERGEKLSRSGIQKIFKKIAKKAKLEKHYSIHCLRHTYATQIYKASGFNLRLVQQQLGHASITTTSVYSHVDSEQLEDAISSLEEE